MIDLIALATESIDHLHSDHSQWGGERTGIAIDRLIDAYRTASTQDRARFDAWITPREAPALLIWSRHISERAMAEDDRSAVEPALWAIIMAGMQRTYPDGLFDGRESIEHVAMACHAARAVGLDDAGVMEQIAADAGGRAAVTLRTFATLQLSRRDIRHMGWWAVPDERGVIRFTSRRPRRKKA